MNQSKMLRSKIKLPWGSCNMSQQKVKQELQQAAQLLSIVIDNPEFLAAVSDAATLLVSAFKRGNKVISCGNGGSHCDAMHFAEELTGRFRENRPGLPAIAISDPSHLSCVANDFGYEYVFARYIESLGQPGDVLFGLSTSGNSRNILQACESARAKSMAIVLLTGNDGGKMAGMADVEIRVPHYGYADRIQEVHIKVIHSIIMLIEHGMSES